MAGRIRHKHADLTILHTAQARTILAGDPDRVFPLFGEARLVKDQDPLGLAHIVVDQAMVGVPHLRLIPDDLTETPLHRPHVAAFYPQRDGLDRFAFQGTELAYHIAKEMLPRLAPGKTLVEDCMKTPQFVK